MENKALIQANSYQPVEVLEQVKMIQDLMSQAMKVDEHYGKIPGTKKDTLYKAGAEKLGLMFRLRPEFVVTETNLPNNHVSFRIRCILHHITSGQVWGDGVGSCSTLESKYRYRWAKTAKKPSKEEAEVLKAEGKGKWQKQDGQWAWCERIEHENPADFWNTALKMAKKRAHVDATLTATAASDIFTQDVEELQENMAVYAEAEEAKAEPEKPKESPIITKLQLNRLHAITHEYGVTKESAGKIVKDYGYASSADIEKKDYEAIITKIKEAGTEPE